MRLPDGRCLYASPCGNRTKCPAGRRTPLYLSSSNPKQAGLCLVERLLQEREMNYQRIVELEDKTVDELEEIIENIQCTLPTIIILSYNSFSKLQFETFGCNVVVTFNTPKIGELGTNHLHIITHQSSKHPHEQFNTAT